MRLGTFSYYVDFYLGMAVIAVLTSMVAAADPTWLQVAEWGINIGLGAAAWTLLEYVVHRWLYHHAPHFKELHNAHHAEPGAHIGAPPFIGVVAIMGVFLAPAAFARPMMACGQTTGMLAGYIAYMLVHHASHHWAMPQSSWLFQICRHHALHHFHSEECNFGITTSFWDRVFGTAHQSSRAALRARAVDL